MAFAERRHRLYLPVALKNVSNSQNKDDIPHVVEAELDWQCHPSPQTTYPFPRVGSSGQTATGRAGSPILFFFQGRFHTDQQAVPTHLISSW